MLTIGSFKSVGSFRRLAAMVLASAVLLISTALATPSPARAMSQELRTEFLASFAGLAGDKQQLQAIAGLFGLPPEREALLVEYLFDIYSDADFANRMVEEIARTGLFDDISDLRDQPDAMRMGFSLGYEIASALAINGMGKMDNDDIQQFFVLMSVAFGRIDPQHCRAMVQEATSSQQSMMAAGIAVMQELSLDDLRAYLGLSRYAIRLELSGRLPRLAPNGEQMDLANRAFEKAFQKQLETSPRPERVLLALLNENGARDEDFCDAGTVLFRAMASMDGLPGQWMRLAALQAGQ